MLGERNVKTYFVLRLVALGMSVSWVLFLLIPAFGLMHELGVFTLGIQKIGGIIYALLVVAPLSALASILVKCRHCGEKPLHIGRKDSGFLSFRVKSVVSILFTRSFTCPHCGGKL
ncbi:hypothetical protein CGK21_19190 [Vibrio parahaemolyticus]|nr:hypothetical protein CGK21_19190 [Vibrio parahaemolyticus]